MNAAPGLAILDGCKTSTRRAKPNEQQSGIIYTKLVSFHPTLHFKRLTMWVWMVVGLIQSQSVHLSEIANYIPSEADAAGRIMRVRRWLASKWIVCRVLYTPIITAVLQPWAGREVTIHIANNTTIIFPGGVQCTVDSLGVKKGERHYLPTVRITLEADWVCKLAIT